VRSDVRRNDAATGAAPHQQRRQDSVQRTDTEPDRACGDFALITQARGQHGARAVLADLPYAVVRRHAHDDPMPAWLEDDVAAAARALLTGFKPGSPLRGEGPQRGQLRGIQ